MSMGEISAYTDDYNRCVVWKSESIYGALAAQRKRIQLSQEPGFSTSVPLIIWSR